MKTLRLLALLVAAAMFLVACQTTTPADDNGNGDDTPAVTTGTLIVNVNTPATITVRNSSGGVVDTATGVTTRTWTGVQQGVYSVVAEASGYFPQTQPATVVANAATTVGIALAPDDSILGDVDSIELEFTDENGVEFATDLEDNDNKVVTMVAAQHEEFVNVSVLVLDADENPVVNAPVAVSAMGVCGLDVTITPNAVSAAMNSATMVTDADGMVHFTLFAVYPQVTGTVSESLTVLTEGPSPSCTGSLVQLIPVVITATGGDGNPVSAEFKAFFVNISHLYYILGEEILGEESESQYEDAIPSETRLTGFDIGTFINVWDDTTSATDANDHEFRSLLYRKQPQVLVTEQYYPGFVTYVMSGDTDSVGWECGSNIEDVSEDGLECTRDIGEAVSLRPLVELEDLPIEVSVRATLTFVGYLGQDPYEFELKDYTFTKRWVGGYLEIDKYVDQHVLTWFGGGSIGSSSVTQSSYTLDSSTSTAFDTDYTSTVYITVSNVSEEGMTDLSVVDAVPAELGVDQTTISNGGTYDATNHTVTWNNLANGSSLEAGESITFSFDVYARQKPGFELDGDALDDADDYQVPFGASVIRNSVSTSVREYLLYQDPYCVTNGEQFGSVTVTAQNADDVLSWYYTPEEDESDICVVRPEFTIEKNLVSNDSILLNQQATFEITITSINQAASGDLYAGLKAMYPWEFDGSLLSGSGHVAAESIVRNNPYARDIEVRDSFEVGLSFIGGVDFNGDLILPSSTKVVGKDITFADIESLEPGESLTATVELAGVLPSSTIDVLRDAGGYGVWGNCAFLWAPQLNQPNMPEIIGGDEEYYVWQVTWGQNQELDAHTLIGTAAVQSFRNAPYSRGSIADCDDVSVLPVVAPFVRLSTRDEVDGDFINVDGWEINDVNLPNIPGDEVVERDDYFYYRFIISNTGLAAAEDFDFSVVRANTNIAFTRLHLFNSINDGVNWTRSGSVIVVGNGGLTASEFNPPTGTMLAGVRIMVVIEANAVSAGNSGATATISSYSNNLANQVLPLTVTESTSIAQ